MNHDKIKLQGVMEEGYGIIPKLVMRDKELDVVAKAFYAYLCSYTGKGTTAFPSLERICGDLGVSRQRLERHRKKLVEKGYITVTQERGSNGGFKRNVYEINQVIPTLQKPMLQNEDEPMLQKPTTDDVTLNNNNLLNNNNINNIKDMSENEFSNVSESKKSPSKKSESESLIEQQFNEWWNIYDKKTQKKKAFTKFKAAIKKYDYETLKQNTIFYVARFQLDNTYQKNPDTFLHNYDPEDIIFQQNQQQQPYKQYNNNNTNSQQQSVQYKEITEDTLYGDA